MNKNKKLKDSLIKYFKDHPNERLWQAIRNWSGLYMIYGATGKPGSYAEDTFFWKKKNK